MIDANVRFRSIGLQTTECTPVVGFSATLRFVEGILTPSQLRCYFNQLHTKNLTRRELSNNVLLLFLE
jgi:hypothetical protein